MCPFSKYPNREFEGLHASEYDSLNFAINERAKEAEEVLQVAALLRVLQ